MSLGSFSFAFAPTGVAVKVSTGLCGQAALTQGSGIYFKLAARNFVVTSFRNVIPSGDRAYCHLVGTTPAQLIASSWAHGLSLLEIQKEIPLSFSGSSLRVETGTQSLPAQVVSRSGDRHFFAAIPKVLEVKVENFNRDVVGALLVDENNQWLGMVSDLYLTELPGRSALLSRWGLKSVKPEGSKALLNAIPFTNIQNWVQKVLVNQWFLSEITMKPEDFVGEIEKIRMGSLDFSAHCPRSPDDLNSGEYPIGGGDGFGVGGDVSNLPCRLDISLAASEKSFPFSDRILWHDKIVKNLKSGKKISIWLAYDTFMGFPQGYKISDLGDLVQQMQIEGQILLEDESQLDPTGPQLGLHRVADEVMNDAALRMSFFDLRTLYLYTRILRSSYWKDLEYPVYANYCKKVSAPTNILNLLNEIAIEYQKEIGLPWQDRVCF